VFKLAPEVYASLQKFVDERSDTGYADPRALINKVDSSSA